MSQKCHNNLVTIKIFGLLFDLKLESNVCGVNYSINYFNGSFSINLKQLFSTGNFKYIFIMGVNFFDPKYFKISLELEMC